MGRTLRGTRHTDDPNLLVRRQIPHTAVLGLVSLAVGWGGFAFMVLRCILLALHPTP